MHDVDFSTAAWRKSTRSDPYNCVEVASVPAAVGVRDSKDAASPVLAFRPDTWAAFIAGVTRGEFTRS